MPRSLSMIYAYQMRLNWKQSERIIGLANLVSLLPRSKCGTRADITVWPKHLSHIHNGQPMLLLGDCLSRGESIILTSVQRHTSAVIHDLEMTTLRCWSISVTFQIHPPEDATGHNGIRVFLARNDTLRADPLPRANIEAAEKQRVAKWQVMRSLVNDGIGSGDAFQVRGVLAFVQECTDWRCATWPDPWAHRPLTSSAIHRGLRDIFQTPNPTCSSTARQDGRNGRLPAGDSGGDGQSGTSFQLSEWRCVAIALAV